MRLNCRCFRATRKIFSKPNSSPMNVSLLKRTATGTALLAMVISLSGCLKDKQVKEVTFTANVPVYMSYEDLRNSIEVQEPTAIEDPAKVYLYGEYVFVSERDKGVHIYRDIRTAQPTPMAFINIPGNRDIASKDDVLYVDSYIDLVAFDISDINNPVIVDRESDALPYRFPKFDEQYHIYDVDEEQGVVVGWEVKEVSTRCEDYSCIEDPGAFWDVRNNNQEFAAAAASANADGKSGGSSGIAGSLTRFMLHDNMLYAIDNTTMRMFDVGNARNIETAGETHIGMNIETLFKRDDQLFIGSEAGVFIYDIEDPNNPEYISEFEHATGCDPVVVDGDWAYVTVRSGTDCGGWDDQLDVINISDIENPEHTQQYAMSEPYGLGTDNNTLYVCDGASGVKVYDTSSSPHLVQLTTINTSAYDVIAFDGIMTVIGANGMSQYNIEDRNNIVYLNTIAY